MGKVEINNRKTTGKHPNIWKLNNILINSTWLIEEISREIKNNELNGNKNATFQNLGDIITAVLRKKPRALNAMGVGGRPKIIS